LWMSFSVVCSSIILSSFINEHIKMKRKNEKLHVKGWLAAYGLLMGLRLKLGCSKCGLACCFSMRESRLLSSVIEKRLCFMKCASWFYKSWCFERE
jgi:hypothetical protein